ncbi:TPA: hypothetical protein ACHJFG_004854, partial [Escherichia coli]
PLARKKKLFTLFFFFFYTPSHKNVLYINCQSHHELVSGAPGITPFLPKTANQLSARAMTSLRQDPCGKTRLYAFGFTRNNA